MRRDKDPDHPEGAQAPYIDPSITDPVALAYGRGVAERHKYRMPVAGGAPPPIPLLSSEAASGMTMADQAASRHPPPPPASEGGFFEQPVRPAASRPPPNLLPQDLLPEAATKDPTYREGAGSRYATSQPELAYRFGVIRNGQHLAPQQLSQAKPGLSDQTIEGLKAVQDLHEKRAQAEGPEARVEADAASGTSGAAARLGNSDGSPQPVAEADREKLNRKIDEMDDFDFNTFREMMMKDIINNPEQRDIVEKRVQPLDLDSLIMEGYVTQIVPIVPGKFEPEFQSMGGEEDLALKRLIMIEAKSIDVNSRYLLDKFSMMCVAAGLRSINKKPLPDHRDKEGHFDDALFWVKFNRVIRFNFHMLASIGVNYFWFDIRVRKLFVAEKLGNG